MRTDVRRSCLLAILLVAAVSAQAQQSADLAVTKSGPAVAAAGSTVSYVVTLTNNGPDAAANVTLVDEIPEGMLFATATQNTGPAFNCATPNPGETGTITCTQVLFPALSSAQFTFEFTVRNDVVPGTPMVNTATASSGTADPNGANNSASVTTTTPAADLVVSKNGPATANPGDNVSYVVTVLNLGPQAAANVIITDRVPAGMSFVSATHTGGTAGSCTFDPMVVPNGAVTCTIASLPDDASSDFTIVFNIDEEAEPGTAFTNVATATTSTGDPNEEGNSASATTTTPFPPQADLGIAKNAPGSAGPGTTIPFVITLASGGPDTATNVAVTDTLPGDLTFVSLSQSGTMLNCTTPAVGAGGTITCTAATYPAGASTSITINAAVPDDPEEGQYVNTAVVTSDTDFNEENNVASVAVTISDLDVSVLKTGPTSVNAGSTITYTLTVTNAGPDTPFEATLTDTIPAGTTFVSFTQNSGTAAFCTQPAVGGGGSVNCQFELLAPGSATFTLVVTATGSTPSVTNTAVTDTPNNFDTDPSNDTSTVVTTVTPRADLSVFKSGPATVTAGTNVSYTVTVANSGPSAAANVTLTDSTPANTTFVSATQTSGPAFNCTGTLTCSIASLPSGATATFILVYAVSPSATGSISNTAQVASPTADPDSTDLTSTVVSTVAASADLGVTKGGPPTAAAGSNVIYTVTATNFGP
jgi:uncharacterized repeat protein (TIGR01451 family)